MQLFSRNKKKRHRDPRPHSCSLLMCVINRIADSLATSSPDLPSLFSRWMIIGPGHLRASKSTPRTMDTRVICNYSLLEFIYNGRYISRYHLSSVIHSCSCEPGVIKRDDAILYLQCRLLWSSAPAFSRCSRVFTRPGIVIHFSCGVPTNPVWFTCIVF